MARFSFSQKLLLSFVGLLVLVVAVSTFFAQQDLRHASYSYINQSEQALAGIGQRGVTAWLVPRMDQLRATAKQLENVQTTSEARTLLQAAAQGGHFNWVRVGMADGTVVSNSASTDAALAAGYDPRTTAWYKLGQQVKVGDFTDPHLNGSTGRYVITVVTRVKSGPFKGVIGGNIDLTTVENMLQGLKLGSDGYAMLVDDDGTILFAPNRKLIGTKLHTFLGRAQPVRKVAETRQFRIHGSVWRASFHLVHVADSHWYLGLFTHKAAIEKPIMHALWGEVTIAVVALLVGLVLIYLLLRVLLQPVRGMLQALHGLADGEADLTQRLTATTADEFGEMAEAFNRFIERIHRSIGQVAGSTGQLAAAAEELSGTSGEVRSTVDRQQSETEQAATAMNEMSATVTEVARNATEAAQSARQAQENTTRSSELVEANAGEMRRLADEIDQASAIVGELHQGTEKIDRVLEVINGISEQTNLLALNAAIEAARAGEHGRGFAVVADEVRTLARRTQESTAEIQTMIETLQSAAQRAVESIAHGRDRARQSAQQASENSALLSATSEAVTRINDMNAMIASAAEEQSAVAEEINRNVVNISQAGDRSVQGMGQVTSASEELARLASELQSLVNGFKL